MACNDELAAELDAEISGYKRARTNDAASRLALLERDELIQVAVETALRCEKEKRYADLLAGLEQLDNDLRKRETEVLKREDAMVGRECAVLVEEQTNKETAAELREIENTLEERARQEWTQSWDEQRWLEENDLVVREDAVAVRERTVTDREDDLRERELDVARDAEDVEVKHRDYKALEKSYLRAWIKRLS